MNVTIFPIPAFADNYIWIIHDQAHAIVIDPGDAKPVTQYLLEKKLSLTTILITHHHYDHIDGVNELKAQWQCEIFGPNEPRLPFEYHCVHEQDVVNIDQPMVRLSVIETPGHTLTHICYFNDLWLFCGDTLFSMGCGRMFEGTAEQYVSSLNKIKALPEKTQIFCTHEYTRSNIDFALTVDPDNRELNDFSNKTNQILNKGMATLPSVLSHEIKLNPFLRINEANIRNMVSKKWNCEINDNIACFAMLRKWKDSF